MVRRSVGIAALLGISLFLRGCSGSNDAEVTINAWLPAPLSLEMLSVRVDDGRSVRTLTGANFRLVGGAQYAGPALETARSGTLSVSFALTPRGSAVPASEGAIELPLREDWGYGVDIRPSTSDPRLLCFGCMGSKAFELAPAFRPPQADSVYLVWGGNSISNPVIY